MSVLGLSLSLSDWLEVEVSLVLTLIKLSLHYQIYYGCWFQRQANASFWYFINRTPLNQHRQCNCQCRSSLDESRYYTKDMRCKVLPAASIHDGIPYL